ANAGEVVTGLLYLEEQADDLHANLNTVAVPLNRLGERELCPGAAKLAEINADYRRSEEHTSELQSLRHLVCRLLLEKKKKIHESNLLIRTLTQELTNMRNLAQLEPATQFIANLACNKPTNFIRITPMSYVMLY